MNFFHDRISCLGEQLLIAMAFVATLATRIVADIMPQSKVQIYEWTLMPLLGALAGGFAAYCFNPLQEKPRTIGGRVIVCITGGVIFPRLTTYIHPYIKDMTSDPLILIGLGFLLGSLCFILSFWVYRGAYKRAPRVAEEGLDEAEERIGITGRAQKEERQ